MGPTADDQTGKLVAIVLGVAALGLVVVMVFGGLGSSSSGEDDKSDSNAAQADDAQARDAQADGADGEPVYDTFPFNRALVRTNVVGAKVYVDSEVQCDTPCEIKVPVGDGKTHVIRLEKEGYTNVTHNWRPKNVGEPLPLLPDMKKL